MQSILIVTDISGQPVDKVFEGEAGLVCLTLDDGTYRLFWNVCNGLLDEDDTNTLSRKVEN